MKKLFKWLSCVLILSLLLLTGCAETNDYQITVYSGNKEMTLLHVNASTSSKKDQIMGIRNAILDSEPTDKSMDLFAFYPEYTIEIYTVEDGETITAIVDINGDKVEFYYPGPNPESDGIIYLSNTSSEKFMELIEMQ